jgi:hypothetical protein
MASSREKLITGHDGRGPWPPGSLLASLREAPRQRILGLGAKQQYAGSGRVLIRETRY